MNNEEKLQRFVIKLMDMTVLGEIHWNILDNNTAVVYPKKIPFGAKLLGHAYEAHYSYRNYPSHIDRYFHLYRCQLPIFDNEEVSPNPIGWYDNFSYYLGIYDENRVFLDEISRFVVVEDLYEEVKNQIHPIDDFIDLVLSIPNFEHTTEVSE